MGQDVSIPDVSLRDCWPHMFSLEDVKGMVRRWKNPPFDFCFCLKKQHLSSLIPISTPNYTDFLWRQFARSSGGATVTEIDSLAVIAMYFVFCSATVDEKLNSIFELFDFNNNGSLSRDETVILFLAISQGSVAFLTQLSGSGLSTESLQNECERMTDYFFQLLAKSKFNNEVSNIAKGGQTNARSQRNVTLSNYNSDETKKSQEWQSTDTDTEEGLEKDSIALEMSEEFLSKSEFRQFTLSELDKDGDHDVGLQELLDFFTEKISILPGLRQSEIAFGHPLYGLHNFAAASTCAPLSGVQFTDVGGASADSPDGIMMSKAQSLAYPSASTTFWSNQAIAPSKYSTPNYGGSGRPSAPPLRFTPAWLYGFNAYGVTGNMTTIRFAKTALSSVTMSIGASSTASSSNIDNRTAEKRDHWESIIYPAGDSCILLDLSSQQQKILLRGHVNSVRDLSSSHDGRLLAACDSCNHRNMIKYPSIIIWDIAKCMKTQDPSMTQCKKSNNAYVSDNDTDFAQSDHTQRGTLVIRSSSLSDAYACIEWQVPNKSRQNMKLQGISSDTSRDHNVDDGGAVEEDCYYLVASTFATGSVAVGSILLFVVNTPGIRSYGQCHELWSWTLLFRFRSSDALSNNRPLLTPFHKFETQQQSHEVKNKQTNISRLAGQKEQKQNERELINAKNKVRVGQTLKILSFIFRDRYIIMTGSDGFLAVLHINETPTTVSGKSKHFKSLKEHNKKSMWKQSFQSVPHSLGEVDIVCVDMLTEKIGGGFTVGTKTGALAHFSQNCTQANSRILWKQQCLVENAHSRGVSRILWSTMSPSSLGIVSNVQAKSRAMKMPPLLYTAGEEGWIKIWTLVFEDSDLDIVDANKQVDAKKHQEYGVQLQSLQTVNFPLSIASRLAPQDEGCCRDPRIQSLRESTQYELIIATVSGNILGVPRAGANEKVCLK